MLNALVFLRFIALTGESICLNRKYYQASVIMSE